MRAETDESERTSPTIADPDAEFVGWQETGSGETFALYNITAAGHPLGSTVTDKHLREMNLQVPDAPPAQESEKKS